MPRKIKSLAVFLIGMICGAVIVTVIFNLHSSRQYHNQLESMSRLAKVRENLIAIQQSGMNLRPTTNEPLESYFSKIGRTDPVPIRDAWDAPIRISVVDQTFVVWSDGSDRQTGGGHSRGPICDSWEDIGITNSGFITWVSGTGPYLTSSNDVFRGHWKKPKVK